MQIPVFIAALFKPVSVLADVIFIGETKFCEGGRDSAQ